ncbi:hypothetical protein SLA2020_374870 [Shorea laevis]
MRLATGYVFILISKLVNNASNSLSLRLCWPWSNKLVMFFRTYWDGMIGIAVDDAYKAYENLMALEQSL